MQAVYRLKKNSQFKYVYRRGNSIACKNLIMVYVRTNSDKLKVGFSISKKIGKSVVRNKVKRRMKEAFRKLIPTAKQNYHYVFIARACIVDDEFKQILNSMNYLLKKADLLQKSVANKPNI